jgi:hypothetical protein
LKADERALGAGALLLAVLIVAATVTFAVGAILESNQSHEHAGAVETTAEPRAGVEAEAEDEAGEHSEAAEAGGGRRAAESGRGGEADGESEEILGIDPESTPLVVLAVIASLGLAAAVLRWPGAARLLWLVALAMVAFAALDVREVFHQLDENREGIALLTALVAMLHLSAACLGALQARESPPP